MVQKAKSEYSSLGQVFNKGLNVDEKNELLLKRLKNIEDQSKTNKKEDSQLGVKSIGYTVNEKLSQKAKHMVEKLNNQEKLIDYRKLSFRGGKNKEYDFSGYRPLRKMFRVIYYGDVLIPVAEREQERFDYTYKALNTYRANKSEYKKEDRSFNQ